ncbi:MAG: class I SAM-dependent methyltransferase, partial [Candidatus Hydrogenedentales bacterium]
MNPDEYARMFHAEQHHWWYRALRQLLKQIWNITERSETISFLDIGCGTGANLAELPADACRIGVDLSREALRFAHSRGIATLARADAVALPFADESFDAALMIDVLYHAAVPDKAAALREARRVLRPGGILFVNVPAYNWLTSAHDRAVHAGTRFTAPRLRTLLVQAHLEPLRITYWNTLLFPPIALARLAAKRRPARSDLESPPSPWANAVFGGLLALERRILRVTNLPFGVSIFAVARAALPRGTGGSPVTLTRRSPSA